MTHKPVITVVGSFAVGMTLRTSRMPVFGETLIGGDFDMGPGGKGSNQAVGTARLGADDGAGDDPGVGTGHRQQVRARPIALRGGEGDGARRGGPGFTGCPARRGRCFAETLGDEAGELLLGRGRHGQNE